MAVPERRRLGDALLAARSNQRDELRETARRVDVPRRQLWSRTVPELALDAQLYQRDALHGRRSAPHGRGDGSQNRGDRLDLSRAEHETVGAVDARRIWQGRRLRRDRRPRRHLHHHARVLPARDRRQDRAAARELGSSRADCRFPEKRRRRPRRGSAEGLGRVGAMDRADEAAVRPGHGGATRARLHYQLVAADRRQRCRRRR